MNDYKVPKDCFKDKEIAQEQQNLINEIKSKNMQLNYYNFKLLFKQSQFKERFKQIDAKIKILYDTIESMNIGSSPLYLEKIAKLEKTQLLILGILGIY